MASSPLKTRRQKLDAYKAAERMAQSWLEYLATVPANQAMTDAEWFKGWRRFVADKANGRT